MDRIDKATRSRIMASVRSKDTKAEMRVRSTAHKLGFHFRLHRSDLPGKPDLVFPSRHVALFVHGCFWHGHDCLHGRRLPVTNAEYWRDKIRRNIERDARVQEELTGLGWRSAVVWECEVEGSNLADIIAAILG